MWQADHCELPILLLDEVGKPDKPYLTAIEDDDSRLIVGYRLSFQASTALTTALALRQAICSKGDARWHAYGIPTVFYTDHGSDFTSKHMEQVAADLPMELIFSQVSIPRCSCSGRRSHFLLLWFSSWPTHSPPRSPPSSSTYWATRFLTTLHPG